MRLLHPMMPFISEELYQKLPNFNGKCESITRSPYPVPLEEKFEGATDYFKAIEEKF
jgi:valyl-tRNA synthetase